jgi:diguanylate cyclase (GGDEF)-like protein
MTQHALVEKLPDVFKQAESLPSLPAVAVEVLRLTQSEDTTLDDLAGALAMDPALAAKILRLSNSAAFSMNTEVTTLQRACMVLGLKTVKLMSLSFSLAGSMRASGSGAFDYRQFWRRSVVAAAAGRYLARHTKSSLENEAFLCGLLSHLGQMVAARCLPDEYEAVTREAGSEWPTPELEQRLLGFTGEDVNRALMETWALPSLIATSLAFRRDPSSLPSDTDSQTVVLCRLVMLAWRFEEFLCGSDKALAKKNLEHAAKAFDAITSGGLEAMLVQVEDEIHETAELLDIDVGTIDVASMLAQAQSQLVQVSLGVAIENKNVEREKSILTSLNKELASKALTDKLTGLANRAAFDDALATCVRQRVEGRGRNNLGLLMLDVDKFKLFNDTHGHQTGDEVLKMVGRVIAQVTRETDFAARYGGEEFSVIMPETSMEGMRKLAERIRSAIEKEALETDGKRLNVTISIGGACVERLGKQGGGGLLIKAADHYLYKAKKAGRNRCLFYPRTSLTLS